MDEELKHKYLKENVKWVEGFPVLKDRASKTFLSPGTLDESILIMDPKSMKEICMVWRFYQGKPHKTIKKGKIHLMSQMRRIRKGLADEWYEIYMSRNICDRHKVPLLVDEKGNVLISPLTDVESVLRLKKDKLHVILNLWTKKIGINQELIFKNTKKISLQSEVKRICEALQKQWENTEFSKKEIKLWSSIVKLTEAELKKSSRLVSLAIKETEPLNSYQVAGSSSAEKNEIVQMVKKKILGKLNINENEDKIQVENKKTMKKYQKHFPFITKNGEIILSPEMNENDCTKLTKAQLLHVVKEWNEVDGVQKKDLSKWKVLDLVEEVKRILKAMSSKWNAIEFQNNQEWTNISKGLKEGKQTMSLKLDILDLLSKKSEFMECDFTTYNEILTDELISMVEEKLRSGQKVRNVEQINMQNKEKIQNNEDMNSLDNSEPDMDMETENSEIRHGNKLLIGENEKNELNTISKKTVTDKIDMEVDKELNRTEPVQDASTKMENTRGKVERNIDEEMYEEMSSSEALTEECVRKLEENKFGLRYSALIQWKKTLSEGEAIIVRKHIETFNVYGMNEEDVSDFYFSELDRLRQSKELAIIAQKRILSKTMISMLLAKWMKSYIFWFQPMEKDFFDSDDINELRNDELMQLIVDMLSPIGLSGTGVNAKIVTKRRLEHNERNTVIWKAQSNTGTNRKIENFIGEKIKKSGNHIESELEAILEAKASYNVMEDCKHLHSKVLSHEQLSHRVFWKQESINGKMFSLSKIKEMQFELLLQLIEDDDGAIKTKLTADKEDNNLKDVTTNSKCSTISDEYGCGIDWTKVPDIVPKTITARTPTTNINQDMKSKTNKNLDQNDVISVNSIVTQPENKEPKIDLHIPAVDRKINVSGYPKVIQTTLENYKMGRKDEAGLKVLPAENENTKLGIHLAMMSTKQKIAKDYALSPYKPPPVNFEDNELKMVTPTLKMQELTARFEIGVESKDKVSVPMIAKQIFGLFKVADRTCRLLPYFGTENEDVEAIDQHDMIPTEEKHIKQWVYNPRFTRPNKLTFSMRIESLQTIRHIKDTLFPWMQSNRSFVKIDKLRCKEIQAIGCLVDIHTTFYNRITIKSFIKEELKKLGYKGEINLYSRHVWSNYNGERVSSRALIIEVNKEDRDSVVEAMVLIDITKQYKFGKFVPFNRADISDETMNKILLMNNNYHNETRKKTILGLENIDEELVSRSGRKTSIQRWIHGIQKKEGNGLLFERVEVNVFDEVIAIFRSENTSEVYNFLSTIREQVKFVFPTFSHIDRVKAKAVSAFSSNRASYAAVLTKHYNDAIKPMNIDTLDTQAGSRIYYGNAIGKPQKPKLNHMQDNSGELISDHNESERLEEQKKQIFDRINEIQTKQTEWEKMIDEKIEAIIAKNSIADKPDMLKAVSSKSMSEENISKIEKLEEKIEKNIKEKITSVQNEMSLKFKEMEKKHISEIDKVFKTFSSQMSETINKQNDIFKTYQTQMQSAMNQQIEKQQDMNAQLLKSVQSAMKVHSPTKDKVATHPADVSQECSGETPQ